MPTQKEWEEAKAHLDYVIKHYREIGITGTPALFVVLLPLRDRYENGERTQELYDDMMCTE